MPFIVSMTNERDANIRVLALWMIGKLTDAIDSIQQHLPSISPLLATALNDGDIAVQVEAIKTLCKLIAILEDEKTLRDHSKAFPIILPLIEKLVIAQSDDAVLAILTALVEVVKEENGELFKPCLDKYGVLMMLLITAGTPIFTSLPTMIHGQMFQSYQQLINDKTLRPASVGARQSVVRRQLARCWRHASDAH